MILNYLEAADSENFSIAAGLSDSEVNLPLLKPKGTICSSEPDAFHGAVFFSLPARRHFGGTRPFMGDPKIFLGFRYKDLCF